MSRIRWNQSLAAVTTAAIIALAALSWSYIARADAVLDWNAIAVNTIATGSPPRPGPVGFLDLAVVQAAVYDAVQAIDGKFKPYHVQIPGASGSPEAATAKAAHDVLVQIFPAQAASLDTAYRDFLAKKGLAEDNPGVAVAERLRPVSSPCGPTTDVYRTRCRRPSPATLPPASGAPDDLLSARATPLRGAYGDAVVGRGALFHAARRRPVPCQAAGAFDQSTVHHRL
jgi:hypothetical protein